MRLEHHLVGGYVRYISPYNIIIIIISTQYYCDDTVICRCLRESALNTPCNE